MLVIGFVENRALVDGCDARIAGLDRSIERAGNRGVVGVFKSVGLGTMIYTANPVSLPFIASVVSLSVYNLVLRVICEELANTHSSLSSVFNSLH